MPWRAIVISACALAWLSGCRGSWVPASPNGTATAARPLVTEKVLYSFSGSSGANPAAQLINVNGTLYGTTSGGGARRLGTVFSISTAGKEKVLHSFGSGKDGADPEAALIDVNGTLYGTTFHGGAYTCVYYHGGCGTVFSISTAGKEKVLHNFGYRTDGANPSASLININGTLFGTTSLGGGYGFGTIFSTSTAGFVTILHSFGSGGDGADPAANLISVNGTLFGTTSLGGAYCVSTSGCGTVFSASKDGRTENVLHNFGYQGDGSIPFAGLINVNGTLYGTTQNGGAYGSSGTVFSISTAGKEKVLHSFGSGTDGASPLAGLINVKGTLYGTTYGGGTYGGGTVFSISTGGAEKVLHSFGSGTDGAEPAAGLIDVKGTLYGTTYTGGAQCVGSGGCGTIFTLTP